MLQHISGYPSVYSQTIAQTQISDNFAHRTAVRKALAEDKEWNERYITKARPMLVSQVLRICVLLLALFTCLPHHLDQTEF